MPEFACSSCDVTADAKRLPKGWKDIPGSGPTCGVCVAGGWVSRCVRLQVAEVMGSVSRTGELTPEDYRGRFFEPFLRAWRLSTDLANWGQQQLLRHDVRRTPDMNRLPVMPPMPGGLYRRWNDTVTADERRDWDGCTQSAAAILRAVDIKWKSSRFGVLWRGESSACTYRHPFPCVVPGQSVRMAWYDHPGGRVATISLLMPGTGRVMLRVDRGRDWHRQLRDFDAMSQGQAVQGDVKVCGDMANGKLSGVKLMCFGRFRRRPTEPTGKTAVVRTTAGSLLMVELPDRDEPFVVHRPDLIGHVAAHERYRECRSVDMKYEKRWPARQRRRFVEGGQAANTKYANRITTVIQQTAASVVGFCRRNRVDAVVYDDTVQTYIRNFRYFSLRERVRQNCDTAGIRFQTTTEVQVESGDQ
jgi:hypothetical protein